MIIGKTPSNISTIKAPQSQGKTPSDNPMLAAYYERGKKSTTTLHTNQTKTFALPSLHSHANTNTRPMGDGRDGDDVMGEGSLLVQFSTSKNSEPTRIKLDKNTIRERKVQSGTLCEGPSRKTSILIHTAKPSCPSVSHFL
ncbi:Uncharacterized protein TCM_020253 [Theobroma cacao]|uniref:Uncharacterized protein n=1 Tax=Theobroma cacao TaxID=3641 RepID=A0A061EK30_THECC|nr:Uncharacterized protein TCM_020253 [Theobroma cacao]